MREPEHAASVIAAMTNAVKIPVTVKMRAGWDERNVNASDLAKRVEDAGASAVAVAWWRRLAHFAVNQLHRPHGFGQF